MDLSKCCEKLVKIGYDRRIIPSGNMESGKRDPGIYPLSQQGTSTGSQSSEQAADSWQSSDPSSAWWTPSSSA